MIGYHFTTRENWEQGIALEGLKPDKVRDHELNTFRNSMPDMQDTAIWLWKDPLTPEEVWISTALLSDIRGSFDLVLLEVEYDDSDAATVVYKPDEGTVKLKCNFSAGRRKMKDKPIELLVNPITPNQITKVWEVNLLAPFDISREISPGQRLETASGDGRRGK